MKSMTQSQVALVNARQELKNTLERVKELRMKVSNLQFDAAAERAYQKSTRQMLRAQKRLERIAKIEARLEAMRLKASAPKQIRKNYRKPSNVTVYSPEQIAALNAANGVA
jgi:ribosomal protein S15P/S13E